MNTFTIVNNDIYIIVKICYQNNLIILRIIENALYILYTFKPSTASFVGDLYFFLFSLIGSPIFSLAFVV